MKFIYITAFVNEGFFLEVKKGMNDAADMLGVGCTFTGTPDADVDTLNRMVRQAIQEKYDGIAVDIFSPGIFTDVIKEAKDAGIPVIAFNIDDPGSGRLAGVQQNFYRAGKSLGERALPRIQENSTVIVALHDEGVSALDERAQGISEAITGKNVKIKTVITGNTPDLAKEAILKNLSSDVSAVLCTGQSDTEGAGLAIQTLAGAKPYLAGFDVSDGIKKLINEGIIDFSIDQQPYIQGFYPLLMLYQNATRGIVPFDIDCGSDMIDKESTGFKVDSLPGCRPVCFNDSSLVRKIPGISLSFLQVFNIIQCFLVYSYILN
ncbi:MAG: substrate-binding domain-containing protein [Treponema sp.]|nr:substrate-binding domain-containing protein [Treponema sp.]